MSSTVVEFTFKSNYQLNINLAEIPNLAHAITVAFPFKYPIDRRLGAREVRIEALGQGGAKGNTALYGRQRCGSGAAGHHDGDWRKSRTTACRHSALERSNDTLLTLPEWFHFFPFWFPLCVCVGSLGRTTSRRPVVVVVVVRGVESVSIENGQPTTTQFHTTDVPTAQTLSNNPEWPRVELDKVNSLVGVCWNRCTNPW